MQNISEVQTIIDELETRINAYSDKAVWQKSNTTDWYTFIIEKGPIIVHSWRELAGMISLASGDQLLKLQAEWDQMFMLLEKSEALSIAMKFKSKREP
jgi:hypothetical protein